MMNATRVAIGEIVGPVTALADILGAPEAALRLLFSILAGYPLALIYRAILYRVEWEPINHLYFALSGFLLIVWNYGTDAYHSCIAIIVTYALIRLLYTRPNYLVIVNFIFHMTYLLVAYYFTESEDYDIIWTMPHCVLVLRLIGLGFNVSDGTKEDGDLSKKQAQAAIPRKLSLLEIAAFTYFPACCLVGPQFTFARYLTYIRKEYRQYTGCWRAAGKRLMLGIIYLALRQIGAALLPDDVLLSKEFAGYSTGHQWILLAFWGKVSLYKYVSCWLLAEGAAILFGISFVRVNDDGTEDWSALSNIRLGMFESATKLGHYVLSFNVNTNHWVAENIYKRLKFLNNRNVSYGAALLFLALWHGFHSGYYMSFAMEFMTITFEKQISDCYIALVMGPYGRYVESLPVEIAILIVRVIYTLVGMGWCLVPFVYLRFDRWWHIYGVLNYAGFYLVFWFIAYALVSVFRRFVRRVRTDRTE